MILAEVNYNLDRFAAACRLYGQYSDKTEAEIVAKQSGELSWNVSGELRKLAPARGSVRSSRLEALKAGQGVKVRDAVYNEIAEKYNVQFGVMHRRDNSAEARRLRKLGFDSPALAVEEVKRGGKYLNFQALAVERELAIRESARGFSGYAAPKPASRAPEAVSQTSDIESRYGFTLSDYDLNISSEHKFAMLRWLGSRGGYESAVEGLSKPKQQTALSNAVRASIANIEVYVNNKMKEAAAKAFN